MAHTDRELQERLSRHVEECEDTLLDLSLAMTRLLSTSEHRHSLDEVLERFGLTREELLEETA